MLRAQNNKKEVKIIFVVTTIANEKNNGKIVAEKMELVTARYCNALLPKPIIIIITRTFSLYFAYRMFYPTRVLRASAPHSSHHR